MEPMVGIDRFMFDFQFKNTRFLQQMQATLALPERTISNPFTEGFTETFTEGFQSRQLHPKSLQHVRSTASKFPAMRVSL